MSRPSETLVAACQRLKRLVRYESASLRLETTEFPAVDTPAIREATRLYTESWIVPILDAIERGDTRELRDHVR